MHRQAQPDSSSNSNDTLRRILDRYKRGGIDAVRLLLRENHTPDAKIESILAQLQQHFPDLPSQLTMPSSSLQSFLQNVYVVKTDAAEHYIETTSASMKDSARWSRERRDYMTAAFFEALVDVLNDKPVTLADDNPYKKFVLETVEAIEYWKSQQ